MKTPNWLKRKPREIKVNLNNLNVTPNIPYVLSEKIDSWVKSLSNMNRRNTIETKVIPCKGATGDLNEIAALLRIVNRDSGDNYTELKCPRYKHAVPRTTDMAGTVYDMCYCVDREMQKKIFLDKNEEPSNKRLYKCPYAGKFE